MKIGGQKVARLYTDLNKMGLGKEERGYSFLLGRQRITSSWQRATKHGPNRSMKGLLNRQLTLSDILIQI